MLRRAQRTTHTLLSDGVSDNEVNEAKYNYFPSITYDLLKITEKKERKQNFATMAKFGINVAVAT